MTYKVFTNQGVAATGDVIIRASGRAFISWHLCRELGLNDHIGIDTIHYLLEFDDESLNVRITFGPADKFNDPDTKDWIQYVKNEKKGISIDLKGLLVHLKIPEKKHQLTPEVHGGNENYLVIKLSSLIPGRVEIISDSDPKHTESDTGNGQESSEGQATDDNQEPASGNDPGLDFSNIHGRHADGL